MPLRVVVTYVTLHQLGLGSSTFVNCDLLQESEFCCKIVGYNTLESIDFKLENYSSLIEKSSQIFDEYQKLFFR